MPQLLNDFVALLRAFPRALAFYHGSPHLLALRALRVWRREGLAGVRRRAGILLREVRPTAASSSDGRALYGEILPLRADFAPKVSVIVPNYNHAAYLVRRLDSIFQQTYQNIEVILLDDGSSDASTSILRAYAQRYPRITQCIFNQANSGSVFRQWQKGLDAATGELVWIAESDDYCAETFLSEVVRAFQNSAVMLSLCDTKFVSSDERHTVWTLSEYMSDLSVANWSKPFIKSARSLVNSGWAVKNIVPNVSGVVFKNPRGLSLLDDEKWLSLRLCGDWVFYLVLSRGGLVAYTPSTTNYYRQHGDSTSKATQKSDAYYAEHEIVATYLIEGYGLDRGGLGRQESQLYSHWCGQHGLGRRAEFNKLYDLERAFANAMERRPNVLMAVYALIAGGGETFPIVLANLLRARGCAVTLLNCMQHPSEPGVVRMIDPLIPRLELQSLEIAAAVCEDLGIDLVHSHHAWVDVTLANALLDRANIRHVVTTHGMYELLPKSQLEALLPLLALRIDHFVYTANKNIEGFPEAFVREKRFTKIYNALPDCSITPVCRESLDVADEDFVLCMVARGIPEKGWVEAVQAVGLANQRSSRRIRLIVIGDGPEYERLSASPIPDYVRLLGFRGNVRDFFAASDMGLLPSRFKGESAPLVIIDCLLAGKPVLASNIGEVRRMLEAPDGLAGEVFELQDWQLNVEAIAQSILDVASEQVYYQELCRRVPAAARKFSSSSMVDKYLTVYRACLGQQDFESISLSQSE